MMASSAAANGRGAYALVPLPPARDENGRRTQGASTVLVVEPDERVLATTSAALARDGFNVVLARSASEAMQRVLHASPDLVLLESALPDAPGIQVCRWIRESSAIVVILSSGGTSEAETVEALDAGADDFVTKPYRWQELVARIRAALRRSPRHATNRHPRLIEVGDVVLDSASHEVRVRGTAIVLPLREFELLSVLLASAGRVMSRQELMRRVWGETPASGTKSLDVHIKRLRAKIEADPGNPAQIVTVRGVGYRFATTP